MTTAVLPPRQEVRAAGAALVGLFASTIFLGAFLLFAVQPLIAKFILPWFGGAAGVWTACMLFFQFLLLVGYAYAHVLMRALGPRRGALVHVMLLAAALALLPITPSEKWKPIDDGNPTLRIIALLTTCVGLPYALLAATGPLLQAWLARLRPGHSPYRLYALSNLASLGALLSYPFLIEPLLSARMQALIWSGLFAGYTVLCAACAIAAGKRVSGSGYRVAVPETRHPTPDTRYPILPETRNPIWWLLLPACGVMLLLAMTNKVCQEVAVVPFLWVLPLSVYLLSFVIAFDSPRWYRRAGWHTLLPLALLGVGTAVLFSGRLPIGIQLGMYGLALLVTCMVCHGELARLRPAPERLTSFYLCIAAGGALGGLLVAVLAPLVFTSYFELPLSLLLCAVLAGAVLMADSSSRLHWRNASGWWLAWIPLYGLLGYGLLSVDSWFPGRLMAASRNFYGVTGVRARDEGKPMSNYVLWHGRVMHGMQYQDPSRRSMPTTYYGPDSGVGLAMRMFHPDRHRRVGLVGLGAGTLAAYGRPGDAYTFYEINPDVRRYAESYFRFIKDSPATIQHISGDGRLSLERQSDQAFDILVLDAFSGDAIPVHLLTRQAFDLYQRHLRDGGLIAIHITNRHLDLRPVVEGAARYLALGCRYVSTAKDESAGVFASEWMLLSRDEPFLASLPAALPPNKEPQALPRLWTDDSTSLFSILRWRREE